MKTKHLLWNWKYVLVVSIAIFTTACYSGGGGAEDPSLTDNGIVEPQDSGGTSTGNTNSGDENSDSGDSTTEDVVSTANDCDDTSTVTSDSNCNNTPTSLQRAMWVWGSNSVLDASRRNQLLAFAVEKGINLLYLGAWSALNNDPQTLADFIRSCKTRGIEVELLFGERAWAFYENHYKVLNIVDKVIDFANRYPDAQPVAIHLDVEPYSLPEWQQDMESVANQLIDMLEAAHARLGSVMPLIADIPVWYDQRFVTRAGVTRPLDRLVIDAIDGVALMDYRDTQDRIVSDASAELSYASQTGKTVIVGVETLCIEPASITFCEEGSSVMEPILTNIDSLLPGQYSAYAGHAIHHFDSYLTLKP